jgi:hypothetical protein
MLDADAIEAINFEQLATLTDKLRSRNGRRPTSLPTPDGTPAHGVPTAGALRVSSRVAADRFDVPTLAPRALPARSAGPVSKWASGSKSRIETTVHGHRPARAITAPAHLPYAPRPPVTPSWEPLARGSQPSIAHELEAEPAEKTIVVRALPRPENPAARRAHAHWIARTIVIPALVGAIAGLIALL